MAQLYALKPGYRHASGKNERIMIRDPRQKIATDCFTTKEKKLARNNKLIKLNSSKSNKSKLVALEDKGVKERRARKASGRAVTKASFE